MYQLISRVTGFIWLSLNPRCQTINIYSEPKQKIQYETIDYTKLNKIVGIHNNKNGNDNYAQFENILKQTIQHCKVKKTKIQNPPKQDWVNKSIIHKINQKNILWKQHKSNPKDEEIEKKFVKEKKPF
ncbi:unnamed protein product [Leptidea sinapis]|uniref:Uncharacterized protein n=1 Tax=Leptidea sinapis TaxID=189913 RepID=A0A5E4QMR4_9NEOP|nr:unnamed protein product [Leptidea sinapis]